jgi:PAS domain S-box-containing protein
MTDDILHKLRVKAEEQLAKRERRIQSLERADLAMLAHELDVHQVELEMQNEELRLARTAAEEARDRYLDLYDFAPMGYFTVDEHSRIIEANLTASELLKIKTKHQLLNTHFTKYITPEESNKYHFHHRKVLESDEKQTLELKMQKADGTLFDVQLISVKAGVGMVRTAVIDITERKKLEEALIQAVERESAVSILASRLVSSISIADISQLILENAERLTGSAFGFIGYVDPKAGFMISPSMIRGTWEPSPNKDKVNIFKKFDGLWGWVLNNRQSFLTNTPPDDPRFVEAAPSHVPITSFISTPALIGTELVGQVAVANSNRKYSQHDLELMDRLATLYAIAIKHFRAEDHIRQMAHHDPLTGLPI